MFPSMMSTPAILEIRLTQKKIKEITSQDFQFVPDSLSLYTNNISGVVHNQDYSRNNGINSINTRNYKRE